MKSYFLIQENHVNHEVVIIKSCNKYDGLEIIQELAERYIHDKLGNVQIKYYLPNDHNRPFTYYIEKSRLNGLTIKNKFSNKGYFVNDVVHQKIISWYLSEIEQYESSMWYYFELSRYNLYDKKWKTKFINVLEELKKKVLFFDPDIC
jgi:hypothetical protein